MKRCSRIVVKGKVQGVSYRDYVKKEAQEMHFEGTIQNSKDGTVVVNACGPAEKFEELIDILYAGTARSKIESVVEEPMKKSQDFRGIFRKIGEP